MKTIKMLNQVVMFLIEIVMLVILFCWSIHSHDNYTIKYSWAICSVIIVVLLWGYFAAPKSKKRLRPSLLALFKLVLFSISASALYVIGYPRLAAVFGIVTLSSILIEYFVEKPIKIQTE